MNNDYKFILEPYKGRSTRHICPRCKEKYQFSRYIDIETSEYVSNDVGRCNREINCGYHYTPKQYFEDNNLDIENKRIALHRHVPKKETSFIQPGIFKKSLVNYNQNNFIEYLVSLFGETITSELISRYYIGTSKHWKGATVFWQIDSSGKIRTGKIMLYNAETGKRKKEPFSYISWVHSVLNLPDFNLKQCYFGEYLLKDNDLPIAIVESEKTAVIASVYLPQFIWLAAGSSTNLKESNFKPLQGRKVVLYPDLNCFDKWKQKADELAHMAQISVSDLLEQKASEEDKKQGFDIADYLIKFDFREFTLSAPGASELIPTVQQSDEVKTAKPQPEPVETLPELCTVGTVFDYYYKKGYKHLPPGIIINVPGWPIDRCN